MTITGRVKPAETDADKAAQLPAGQVESINPSEQASRLGSRSTTATSSCWPASPARSGLVGIPEPDLSNPAGGAVEPQHLAYVIQWYLFALLALAAPIVMARAERAPGDEPSWTRTVPITPTDASGGPARRPLRTPRELTARPNAAPLAREQFLDRVQPGLRIAALARARSSR